VCQSDKRSATQWTLSVYDRRFVESGEGGIIPTPSSQGAVASEDTPQAAFWQHLVLLWSLGVVYGHLVLSGITFSTNLAHFDPELFATHSNVSRSSRRTRSRSIAASYARYSSDLQDASSIDQQRRKCRDRAAQEGNEILPEFEFCDEAVSGTKRERVGLNAMLEAARDGRFQTLYFESLSRLARESVITMPVLKELVSVRRIRIVSTSEGIDSTQQHWDLMATMLSWQHEQYVKTLRTSVLRGQEEAVLKDWSVGDYPFGYTSEPVPGTESARRGRHPRPRMRVMILEEHAQWVRQIFKWFVEDARTLDWITRELSRQKVPKDHRSTTPGWHHDMVKRVLRNQKFIGIWPWGKKTNVRNPLTGDIKQELRPEGDSGKQVRERPQLRIIDDITYFRAQALLDESCARWNEVRKVDGTLKGSKVDSLSSRHLLQGLFRCGSCGRTFQVSGGGGKYLGCSGYKSGLCRCKTRLPRRVAERKLLATITDELFSQRDWLDAAVDEAVKAWNLNQSQEPSELTAIEHDLVLLEQKIARLIDAVERGESDGPELSNRLRQRQKDKKDMENKQACLLATTSAPTDPPTRAWMETKLRRMEEVLSLGGAEANKALRQLVCGHVILEEARTPGRKRKHFVGRFSLDSRSFLSDLPQTKEPKSEVSLQQTRERVISFREDPPWAALAEVVKKRFDEGVEFDRIAKELGCHRTWATRALAWWHYQNGSQPPDGRRERGRLKRPTKPTILADAAKELWDASLPMKEIAEKLGCDRSTGIAAIRHWFESRDLPVPDGRTRRKELRLEREAQQ